MGIGFEAVCTIKKWLLLRGVVKRKNYEKKQDEKKGIALLLALTMAAAAMTGCGDKKESEPVKELDFADIAGDTTNDADNAPESPDVEESFTEQAEEETREGMYRSEITNEWIDESLKNQRPIAVMVDNEKTALPHYGLTEADVVYELMNSTANGRITRFGGSCQGLGKD